MRNHPANKDRQIKAVRDAGHDPKIGSWPGDPGYVGDGSVGVRAFTKNVLEVMSDTFERARAPTTFEDAVRELIIAYVTIDELRNQVKALRGH